ncbi:MAG: hypothetical protein QM758_19580 [Armatimonas sp.]
MHTSVLLCKLQSGKLIKIRVDMMSNRPHHMTYYALQGTKGVYETQSVRGAAKAISGWERMLLENIAPSARLPS